MNRREFYREFFANVSKYFKLKSFCLECDISPSNLSNFIKYGTSSLSTSKLHILYIYICDYCDKIA